MYYIIENQTVDNLKPLNDFLSCEQTNPTHHLIIYIVRNSNPVAYIGFFTLHEWRTFHQFVISSEYQKALIDIYLTMDVNAEVESLLEPFVQSSETLYRIL